MKTSLGLFVLLSFFLAVSATYRTLDLSTASWTLSNEPNAINVPGSVPGGVYTDLQNGGVLDGTDFYYRFNDADYRWVARENWTYSASFVVDSTFTQEQNIILDVQGMDTVSTIYINGFQVGTTDNMFVRYSFDVSTAIFAANNFLEVVFQSPLDYSQKEFDEQSLSYVVPPECVADQYQGECHANHIRKMQASFSWDWGPAFPSMGVYRPLVLEAFEQSVLRYVKWTTTRDDSRGVFSCELGLVIESDPGIVGSSFGDVEVALQGLLTDTFSVTFDSPTGGPFPAEPNEAVASITFDIPISSVQLWWPNGYGDQPLYDLTVTLTPTGSSDRSTVQQRVGFRTIEVVQDPISPTGLTFLFRVNGLDIFMKGSNWIPAHVLPEQVSDDYTYALLHSAREAHMNMVRVWGGGIYESEAFYEACDELGILVWQDHMFACSMYQVNEENLISDDRESKTQIRRLQHHASIALWAGNNENEAALVNNWYGTANNYGQYAADYVTLYVDTLMQRVAAEDPSRTYLVSSPTNGDESIAEGYLASNPYDSRFGDVHYYNYASDNWDYTIYPMTRFASEYGFQSLPAFEILSQYSIQQDWALSSEFANNRMRHPNGYEELKSQIGSKMNLPSDALLDTEEGFREFLYLAQVYQAQSLKTSTEFFRRLMFRIDDESTGEGYCAGALYWQLNDVWPGASWTSQEYGGNWRASHYIAERMFQPVLISPYLDVLSGYFKVDVVSDLTTDLIDVSIVVDIKRWDSLGLQNELNSHYDSIPAQSSQTLYSVNFNDLLLAGSCSADPTGTDTDAGYCYVTVRLEQDSTGEVIATNEWMPYPINSIGMSVPNIQITDVTLTNDFSGLENDGFYSSVFTIGLTTDAVAPHTWLTAEGISGHFDRNSFLLDTATSTVRFLTRDSVSASQLQSALKVRSYMNTELAGSRSLKYLEMMEEDKKEYRSVLKTGRSP